jgi:tellurite methyltransferase
MKEITHKYQKEYETSNGCFWDTTPAKFVKLFSQLPEISLSNLNVLDLGAGEGKNAVFLANLNANVIAVDVSMIALSRFTLQPNYHVSKNRIVIINNDVKNLIFGPEQFDVIVAYGILHCLNSKEEIILMLENIKTWLKKGGYFICATFTNNIPVPKIQSYLDENAFLTEGELEKNLTEFTIINSENSVITETHPTSGIEHNHSIVRIIAKKNV